MELKTGMFFERVRQGYLELARAWPLRFRVIDAAQSLDAVASDVIAAVEAFLDRQEA